MLLGYTRVSTTEQAADDRSSLMEQERRVRGISMMHGEDNPVIYSDPGVSGSMPLRDRPAGARLMAEMRKGDIVVAAKLDRMFRSCSDALTTIDDFQKAGVGVILADISTDPVTESGVGRFFFTIMAAAAEFERKRIVERITEGKRAKKARGGRAGGAVPYGYRCIGKGRDAILVPLASEQAVIARARILRANHTLAETCSILADEGMFARNGKQFVDMQVARMVKVPPVNVAA